MNLIRTSLSLSLMGPALVWAQDIPFEAPPLQPSQMDFGGVGLMQMPTGRMAPEGEFNFAVTGSDEYLFYNVTLQVMPWLETTIRYTMVNDLSYSSDPSFSGDTKYTDKGIDFKVRLFGKSLNTYQSFLWVCVILLVPVFLMVNLLPRQNVTLTQT
ncbi:YjbH domain-containing protein [Vibrio harveyi]|nr:YjbH domain-containing protein [Vibrio harveyi]